MLCNITFSEKKFKQKLEKDEIHQKVRDYCQFIGKYRGAVHSTVLKKILVVFHNRSNYDYYFMVKESPNEFKGRFECL